MNSNNYASIMMEKAHVAEQATTSIIMLLVNNNLPINSRDFAN